jgi:Gpi18-like mannosyltransferase
MAEAIEQTQIFVGREAALPELLFGAPSRRLPQSRVRQVCSLAFVAVAGLAVRLALIQSAGYRDDIAIFEGWFRSIATLAPADVYAGTPGLNYPPMVVLLYEFEALIMRPFLHGTPSPAALTIAVKLPPILADAAGTVLVYAIVRRFAGHPWALLAAAFIAFNPAIIYDSAFWGQNDAIPTVLALFALYALLSGNTVVAWLSMAAALFFKPPVLVLVPLLLAHPFRFTGAARRGRLVATGYGIAGAALVAELLASTFFEHPNLVVATRHLIGQYLVFSNVFPYTSLNAFNVWALGAPFFSSDGTKVLGLSLHLWSDAAFAIAAGCIYVRYLKSRSATGLLEAATLVLLAFFLLLTEMHERYLYYALFFAGTLVFKRPYGYAALVLTATLLLNLEYGLTFMYLDDAKATMVDRFAFSPWLTRLCSLANIGMFGWLARERLSESGRG